MSKVYKTMRGKSIDFDKVKLANEDAISVGNMRTNARGDIIGPGNAVATGRNQLMDQVYAVPSAPPLQSSGYSPNDPQNFSRQQALMEANKAKELTDLTANSVVPVKPTEENSTQPSTTRGSLAGSVAKTATVNQQPLPNPKKPTGPARI